MLISLTGYKAKTENPSVSISCKDFCSLRFVILISWSVLFFKATVTLYPSSSSLVTDKTSAFTFFSNCSLS